MAKVDMESLKPNSYKYKESEAGESENKEKTKLKPVVQNDRVVSTKKSLGQKFSETFLGENLREVAQYVFWDKVVPGLKYLLIDGVTMMFFGRDSVDRRSSSRSYDRDSIRSYSSIYKSRSDDHRRRNRERRYRYEDDYYDDDRDVDYQNVIVKYRQDADCVVDALYERIDEYGAASVADLFDLVNVAGTSTDNNWGWTSKRDIGVRRVEGRGFLIDVAPAEYIGR